MSTVSTPEELFPSHARWIGSAHPFDLHEVYLDFRSPLVKLQDAVTPAELRITADSRYKLWINGVFVARGPSRCHPWQQSVDRLDVTPYIQAGDNVLCIQVYQPGYSHFAYTHRGTGGLLVNLMVGDRSLLVSDETWRVRRNRSFNSLVPRVSIYGSGVEDRDLRLEDHWTEVLYDGSGWASARVVAPLGGYPWLEVQERITPLLVERLLPLRLIEVRRSAATIDLMQDPHLALRAAWQESTPVEAPAEVRADTQWLHAGHEGTFWLFDLGRAGACAAWVEIEDAEEGQVLLVSYAEKLRDGELVISDPQTYCRVRMTDRYCLRAGSQVAEPFTVRGGRYLLFGLSAAPGQDPGRARLRFHARSPEYPLGEVRKLRGLDPQLQQIAHLCEETLAACLQDSFVDSAWRESSLWLGDALPQALILHSMTCDTRPLRQALTLAAAGAYPDGVLPSVLPGEVHAYAIVDYSFMWVEQLSLYQELTGDDDLVRALWPTLVKLLDRFQADVGSDGLIVSQRGRRLFLDWAPVSRAEPNAIYNLHYLLAVQVAARLAEHMGETAAAAEWDRRAAALGAGIRAAFYVDGFWWDDLSRTTRSQLAGAFAVLTHSADESQRDALLREIAARSLDLEDGPIPAALVLSSPFMHYYVFRALLSGGWGDAVVEIIRRRWGRWVTQGCPTAWENWNVDFPDGSQCHAFSAHPRYFLALLFPA
jgi:hypothetical protein